MTAKWKLMNKVEFLSFEDARAREWIWFPGSLKGVFLVQHKLRALGLDTRVRVTLRLRNHPNPRFRFVWFCAEPVEKEEYDFRRLADSRYRGPAIARSMAVRTKDFYK